MRHILLPFVQGSPLGLVRSYELLSDPNSRAAYDAHGMEGISSHGPGGPAGGMDPNDFFAQFFGNGNGTGFDFGGMGGPGRRRKGQDSVIPYEVSLEDLYNGKSVKMMMEKEVECGTCKG